MKMAVSGPLAGALILMLCVSGCSTLIPSSQTPTPGQQLPTASTPGMENRMEGVTWYLVVFHTASGRSAGVLPGTEITVYFDGNGKISGHAGCNRFTATYSGTMNGLTIGDPVTTRMYCGSPDGIMSQEATFLAVLPRASIYRVEGNLLTIMESRGNPLLTLISIKPGPL